MNKVIKIITAVIIYKSKLAILLGIEKFAKKDEIPKTPKILYIFEPNTFPKAKSTFLLKADKIPTDNSGKEVHGSFSFGQ